jgi:hypothetical protein
MELSVGSACGELRQHSYRPPKMSELSPIRVWPDVSHCFTFDARDELHISYMLRS